MEDAAEEIDVCSLDRLLGEEIVPYEFQSAFQLRRDGAVGHRVWEILYDADEIREAFRQRDHGRSVRAAYVNDCAGAEISPWVVVQEMRDVISSQGGTEAHGPCETLDAQRVLGQFVEQGILGPVDYVETLVELSAMIDTVWRVWECLPCV